MTIGERIKQYREKAGLTQVELAEKIDAYQETISQIEHDKIGITVAKLRKICDALGVTIADIVE